MSNPLTVKSLTILLAISVLFAGQIVSSAAEPGWSPVIIATGAYREKIQSTPIENRPYRPLHFYGNSIRRSHYRGNPYAVVDSQGNLLPLVTRPGEVMQRPSGIEGSARPGGLIPRVRRGGR